ncbi:MAG TPA: hypothetical protein VIV65_00940 [Gemmatimonadaceae bacterium]
MDSFESVVAAVLHRQGYWTRTSVKVDLTKAEKRRIGRYSSPRWELDVVGYRASRNELLVVECKSFLDSGGVRCDLFQGKNRKGSKRYKLFFEPTLRKVVLGRLAKQLVASGACRPRPSVILGLAAGKLKGDQSLLASHFRAKGWRFWGPRDLYEAVCSLKDARYENDVATVVAKILLRGSDGAASKRS